MHRTHKAPWLRALNKKPGRNAMISRQTAKARGDKLRGRGKGEWYTKREGQHEHRLIMEKKLGRPLRSDEIVHHIDENPQNNKVSNIELMDRPSHAKHHFFKFKRDSAGHLTRIKPSTTQAIIRRKRKAK